MFWMKPAISDLFSKNITKIMDALVEKVISLKQAEREKKQTQVQCLRLNRGL